jgi:cell division protein FtsB
MLLRALRHGHQQARGAPFGRASPGATVALPSAGLGDIVMQKTTLAAAVTLALCCASSPVSAQGPTQDGTSSAGPSRYSFNRVDNGFLRLDNQSGQVAFCGQHAVGWACEAVPEDRAALEKEIARLQDQVASLKQEVASLREPSPPRPPGELSPPADNRDDAARLREDMERARAALEHAWRGLVDMIITFQKDMMRKG